MGRIDEALRRANLDVGQGTGVLTPEQARSPWLFEPDEGSAVRALDTPSATEPGAETRAGHGEPEASGRQPKRAALDPVAAERLVATDAPPLLVEQFRSLAATLHGAQHERALKSVIVISASPGDGKSYVAVNLALTFSESYARRVLLVDADLRRPSLHRIFKVPNDRGLSEALKAVADEKVTAVRISDRLTLLPAGRPDPNPHSGLSSGRMKHIVEDAASRFDWVIVDSPPVGVLADGRLVCETVDAAILVVRAGVTQFPDVQAAADTIGRERILGIVLNAVEPIEIRGEDYYRQYYGREAEHKGLAG